MQEREGGIAGSVAVGVVEGGAAERTDYGVTVQCLRLSSCGKVQLRNSSNMASHVSMSWLCARFRFVNKCQQVEPGGARAVDGLRVDFQRRLGCCSTSAGSSAFS